MDNIDRGLYQIRHGSTSDRSNFGNDRSSFGPAYSTGQGVAPDPVQALLVNELISLKDQVATLKRQPAETPSYGTSNLREAALSGSKVVLLSNIPLNMANPDVVYYMLSRFGNVERVKILRQTTTALAQFENPSMADTAMKEQNFLNNTGANMHIKICENLTEVTLPTDIKLDQGRTKDFTVVQPKPYFGEHTYGNEVMGMNGLSDMEKKPGNCLLVSKLPEDVAQPDVLFNIFGNYGDVERVKVLYHKTDTAIIQMRSPSQAMFCCRFLNQIKLQGKRIIVRQAGIPSVNLAQDENDEKTKDYSRERTHRFRNPVFAEKLLKKMGSPTSILHVSNLPVGKLDELKEYFLESGFTVKDIRACGKDEDVPNKMRMALVEFSSEEESIMAVGKLHNTMPRNISEVKPNGRGLCLSFSNVRSMDKYFK